MYRLRASFAWLLIALVCSVVCATDLRAAIVMQVTGIPGDSKVTDHKDWIDLDTYQIGMSVGITTSGGTVNVTQPSFADITLGKGLDKSSVPTALKLASGKSVPKVVIEFLTPGSKPAVYYRITLTEAYFSNQSTSSGGDTPTESLSIFYSTILWEYYPVDANGVQGPVVKGGWNVLTNKAF